MFKNLSFRAKLTLIVLPQLVVLLAFATLVVKPRTDQAREAAHAREHAEVARTAMILIDALQEERGLTSWVLAGGGVDARQLLTAARSETDDAMDALSQRMRGDAEHLADSAEGSASLAALDTVAALRVEVDGTGSASEMLFDRYSDVVNDLIAFNSELVAETEEAHLVVRGTAISEFLAAREQLGLLLGSIVRRVQAGTLSVDDLAFIDAREAAEEAHIEAFRRSAEPAAVSRLQQIEASEIVLNSDRIIEQVRTAARTEVTPELTADEWWNNVSVEFNALDTLDDRNFDDYVAAAEDIADSQRNQALLYTAIAAGAVLGSIAGALLLGRSLNNRLASIAEQARVISHERLPEVLEALRHPTAETIAEALPQVQSDATDEIGTMADAFNMVLRTSVETSFGHAQERARTVTNMLLNLGRRNQSLIDRQLAIMDDLESRHDDPDLLERLFRIDHLVTRMRRNAENLVVLAGEHQPRVWTEAVPMLDVLRAATGEVPELERIDISVGHGDDVEVAGPHAVTLSHLLAELVENAMTFSPPSTTVSLSTDRVRGQLRVWVVDNGLGMEEHELAAANARLASPPDIDVLTTDRVGFQVIGRLSQQLGVAVQLQANPHGGVAASVTLPDALFELTRRDGPGQLLTDDEIDLRDRGGTAAAFDDAAFADAAFDDAAFADAAFDAGSFDDAVFEDGVFEDAAFADRAFEDPAEQDGPGTGVAAGRDEDEGPFGTANGFERYDDGEGANGFRRVPIRRVTPPSEIPTRTPRVFQFEPDVPDDLPVIDLRDAPAAPPAVPFGVFRADPSAPEPVVAETTVEGLPKRTPRRAGPDGPAPTDTDNGQRNGHHDDTGQRNGRQDDNGHHNGHTDGHADGRGAGGAHPDGGTAASPGDGSRDGADAGPGVWLTADGLVKRRPGGTMAANARAAEADAGAFRRLPDAAGREQEDGRGRRRFADLSRLQSAVAAAREHDTETEGEA